MVFVTENMFILSEFIVVVEIFVDRSCVRPSLEITWSNCCNCVFVLKVWIIRWSSNSFLISNFSNKLLWHESNSELSSCLNISFIWYILYNTWCLSIFLIKSRFISIAFDMEITRVFWWSNDLLKIIVRLCPWWFEIISWISCFVGEVDFFIRPEFNVLVVFIEFVVVSDESNSLGLGKESC